MNMNINTQVPDDIPHLLPPGEWYAQDKQAFIRNKTKPERQLFLVMSMDILLLNLSLFIFIALDIPLAQLISQYLYSVFTFFLVVNIIGFILAPFTEVYQVSEGIRPNLKIKPLFWGSLIYFGIISLIYYQFFFSNLQIHFLLPSFFCFFGVSTITHYAFRYYNERNPTLLTYAVIGGKPSNLKYVKNIYESVYGKNIHCIGRFAKDGVPGVASLGDYINVESYLRSNANYINKLIYFHSDLNKNEVQQIVQLCRGRFIDFEVVPTGIDFFEKGVHVEQLAHLPIFRRGKEPLCRIENKVLKRSFDILFSILVIVLIFPWLIPIVALLIKLESNGPIFFIQNRTGYWDKPFSCLKFRTMTVNAQSNRQQATKDDVRITRIGAFLRKTNLDELPQFFNVLLGDMSVVGPRPHMLQHTEDYSKLIERFMIRHEVKPGITGWAQVSGWRGPTAEIYKMRKRAEYDVYYIENWSFWFDCKCIFLTIANMFVGEENAF